jgi:serine kinase of HPr protein (carbohydrate metabolism regulator)
LCDGFKHTALVEAIAIKFSTTVILTELHSHQLYLSMAGWISEHLATYSLAHGTVIF